MSESQEPTNDQIRIYSDDIHLHVPDSNMLVRIPVLERLFSAYIIDMKRCPIFRGELTHPRMIYITGDFGNGSTTTLMSFCRKTNYTVIDVDLKGTLEENQESIRHLFSVSIMQSLIRIENFIILLRDPMWAFRSQLNLSTEFLRNFLRLKKSNISVDWCVVIRSMDLPIIKGDNLDYNFFKELDVFMEPPLLDPSERAYACQLALQKCIVEGFNGKMSTSLLFPENVIKELAERTIYMGVGEIHKKIQNAVRIQAEKLITVGYSNCTIYDYIPSPVSIVEAFPLIKNAPIDLEKIVLHPEIKRIIRSNTGATYFK
jgi:hypothetical protein